MKILRYTAVRLLPHSRTDTRRRVVRVKARLACPGRLCRTLLYWSALLALLSFAHPAAAQYYFGKNKVQYTEFDWRVMQTEHFEIYFYESERELAEIAAHSVEDSYRELADRFNHHIRRPIPLIIYSSPNYFTQTNVIPGLLPANVGGFTEFFKGRVVVPFHGSYADFRRVLRHELVHVYLSAKISAVLRGHKKYNAARMPLWLEEGMAEYFSGPWSSEADMVLSDMIITDHFFNVDEIGAISGTYLMYKEGESFCHFLADRYGPETILRLLENWWQGSSFEEIIQVTLGKSLARVGQEWEYWLKKKYYPAFAQTDLPSHRATALTRPGYSVSPCPVRLSVKDTTEEWIVYKANNLGYTGIYMIPQQGGETQQVKTLLKGERSPKFESLHLLRSDLDVSPSGRIAFASKNKERDRLYIMDIAERKITAEFDFPDMVFISSPAWSPDEQLLVFSGAGKDGQVDLYTVEVAAGAEPQRLTWDFFDDRDPVFTPDGRGVVFASDRGRWGQAGYTNLFRMNLADGTIEPVTCGSHDDRQPAFSPDGSIMVFSSDRRGRSNVHALNLDGTIEQWTGYTTGAFNPRFTSDGESIIFTGYQELGFRVFQIEVPDTAYRVSEPQACLMTGAWEPRRINANDTRGVAKYTQKLSFDIAQSAISYDEVFGTLGGFQTALTDVLGNKQYYLLLSNNANTKDDFFKSFSVSVTHIDRTHRVNYGYGLFHLYDYYFDRVYGLYTERQYGGALYLGYPISKFRRLESSLIIRQSDRDVIGLDRRRETLLASQYVSLVHDNSIWDLTGPIDGHRVRLTLGITHDISNFRHFNRLGSIDARKYFRLGRYSCLALWALGQSSSGEEPQRRYLGGSWSLRGYPRRMFYGRHVLLFSNELRFPLIDNLFIKFPLARLGFQAIRGALFFDAGNAWDDEFGRMKGSLGMSARVSLGYIMVLRFDFARRTDFRKIDPKTKFDFFFGWNF